MSESLSSPHAGRPCVLFIDDDGDVQQAAALLLPRYGFSLLSARAPEEAWSLLAAQAVDVVLLDLNFRPGATSGSEGLALLEALVAYDPGVVVVVVTGHSGINIAVAAMRAGASDFVMKPWNNQRLVATLDDAVRLTARRRAAGPRLQAVPSAPPEEGPLIGESAAITRIRALAGRVATTGAPVLLAGPAGSGKTLLARTIHRLSGCSTDALFALSTAALWAQGPDALATAIDAAVPGQTLLLDGVDGLGPAAQALLHERLRGRAGLRLLSTSRLDRLALLSAGFDADLLYRLNLIEITLPPLSGRDGDAALLAVHFLRMSAHSCGRPELRLSPEAEEAVTAAPWPDEVRGLRQAVERAVMLADPTTTLLGPADLIAAAVLPDGPVAADLNLHRSERTMVEAALRRHGFNVSHAARELGLTRTALYRRMARHQL